ALGNRLAPGAAVAIGRHGRIVHMRGYGALDWAPDSTAVAGAGSFSSVGTSSGASAESTPFAAAGATAFPAPAPVTESTLFDVASLTKVVATTTAAMILEDRGLLALDSTVGHFLPKFVARDSMKRAITVRHLLTHQGGLEAYAPLYLDSLVRGREAYLDRIAERPLRSAPGTATVYSDWDMILLQLVVEKVSGSPLEWFFEDHVAQPLGLRETVFRPAPPLLPRTAATAKDSTRGGILRGVVHDGNAWALGGVSGHAGLFSSARDLAAFAHMMLSGGRLGATSLVDPATVARWTAPQVDGSSRALGWDTPSGDRSSAGRHFSQRSFGHTGFTGTSLWIDPEKGVFVVLLTNRVHSAGTTPAGQVLALRAAVADAVQASILDAPVIRWR
ncbi:MAG: serine hydrolase, partial [Gemmatimonadaceae bacterium]|nr:serine hydrolase [Gemmatimonadaceae bacterium]